MNHCDSCEHYDNCEYADGINFCEDCKYNVGCPLKYVSCKAGYDIECNNGWEDREDYCCEDDEEMEREDNA